MGGEVPSSTQIGTQIKEAIRTAPDELLPAEGNEKRRYGMKRQRVATELGINPDTLNRYIDGAKDPSALAVWKIGQMTGRPFSFFACQDDTPEERLAVIAARASEQVAEMGSMLAALRDALAAAVAIRNGADRTAAGAGERRLGRRRLDSGEQIHKPIEPPGEAAS